MEAAVRNVKGESVGVVEVVEPTIDNVISVYSGAKGCMCGCLGNHRYNPAFVEEAAKRRGYSVDEDEVSARSIKTVITKLKKAGPQTDEGNEKEYLFAEAGNRVYVVYFK